MDAAQLTRKIFFCFAVALLLAGAASAQTLVVSTNTVTFSSFVNSVPINVTSSGADFQFTIGAHSQWYTPAQGTVFTTPATINVTRVLGNCLTLGTCNDTFDIIHNGTPSDKQTINVSVDTAVNPGTSGLTANPNPVSIPVVFASTGSTTTTVSTTSGTGIPVSVTQTPAAGSWLSVFTNTSNVVAGSPMTISVFVNANGYSNNTTLTGSITVTPTNGGAALSIPVNMVIGSGSTTGTLIPNPTSASLSYPTGNSSASVYVTSNATGSYNAVANSSNGWLLVNNGYSIFSVSTNQYLQLSLNSSAAALLGTGTYNGSITLTSTINSSDITTIPVTLSINGGGGGVTSGAIAPSTLNFTYQQFGGAPPCQQVLIPHTGTFSITPTGSPLFLYTSGAEINAPGAVLVCAAVGGLNPGTYSNSINIVSPTLGISQSVSVNLTVYNGPVLYVGANSPNATDNGVIGCFFRTGVQGCNDSQLNIRMSDGSSASVTASTTTSWITIDPAAGTTPASFNVRLNTANLPNGANTGTITVTGSSGLSTTVTVPVVVQVNGGTSGSTGNLTFSASSLSFTAAGSQTLSVSAATATSYTASVPSNCTWLTLSPSGASTTPANHTVSVSSSGLTAGQQYSCNISFVAGATTQTVGVTFTAPSGPSGNVTVDKPSLTFSTTTGTSPATQTLAVSSTTSAVAFTVSTNPSGTWLSVVPASGTTPATINVNITATGLSNGAHSGFIYITPNGGQTVQVPVTLNVAPPTAVSATPTTMTFEYIAGNANPAAQQISVTGTGNNLGFTATVGTGAEWLTVSAASGTTPSSIDVRVNPGSLTPGTYTGTIVVAGSGGATGSTTTTVTLRVTAPLPTISRVTNAASFNTGAISAGEIITLFGVAMGPATIQTATPTNNTFPTTLGGVQVTVGGYPAPLIYVRGDQISAIVPYEINRPFLANATVVVRYLGQTSNGVTLAQVGAAPGIFTIGGGSGQGAILNSNLTVNSAGNAAAKGDVVVLYVTGEGVTNPPGVTGRITTSAPYPQPVSGVVTVTIDGQPATVEFYGAAPGLVAGVMQVNVRVPAGAASGSVPVVVRVGDAPSQLTAAGIGSVTVAVR